MNRTTYRMTAAGGAFLAAVAAAGLVSGLMLESISRPEAFASITTPESLTAFLRQAYVWGVLVGFSLALVPAIVWKLTAPPP